MKNLEQVRRYADDPLVREALRQALNVLRVDRDTATLDGFGGQGIIYRVSTPDYKFPLSVKVPYYAHHRNNDVAEHSILKEATVLSLAAPLDVHRVLPRYVGMSSQGRYLIREYINAPLLSELLVGMPYNQRKKLLRIEHRFARNVFELFHDSPYGCIVIRDFKPRNMLLDCKGHMTIIDYGSTRRETEMYGRPQTVAARHELGSGKFRYRPPEQLNETPKVLSRTVDYFAYGTLLFYTLFGRHPFSNRCADLRQAMAVYQREYQDAEHDLAELAARDEMIRPWVRPILAALDLDPRARVMLPVAED